jgi:hypothetical protein
VRHVEHVAELMCNGEGGAEAVVLHDGTAAYVAHGAQLGQAESVAVLARGRRVPADVFPEVLNYSFLHKLMILAHI